ncbi:MAG: hypothetical protein ACRD12_08550, partial [Acidimicrobiales bacterium]
MRRAFWKRRVPWSSVTGVRRGPRWRGSLDLATISRGTVWAPSPSSRWGGRATEEQVAEVTGWWIAHRGETWALPPSRLFAVTPGNRYRTAWLAPALAGVGASVAAINAVALW